MSELIEALRAVDQEELTDKLVAAGYAFALWRMPGESKRRLIVSLQAIERVAIDDLEQLDAGFLINGFEENHPARPHHLKADIVFEEQDIKIDPRINAKDIDAFLNALDKSNPAKTSNPKLLDGYDDDFRNAVSSAVKSIDEGELHKVVLARYKDVPLPSRFGLARFFSKLASNYPNAFCNLVHLPGQGIWMGATPELLIADNELSFSTQAVAGTKRLAPDQPLNQIAWTQKEIEEQAMVSRYIINCFKKIRLREFEEYGPKTMKAGLLAHLKTVYHVDYGTVSFEGLGSQMLELLHPTSAVCGMPLDKALEFIHSKESFQREFFAGFLGPVNFQGSTDLFVNLRCMKVGANKARLFAGAGITADSDPEKEWQETELKMETLARLLRDE